MNTEGESVLVDSVPRALCTLIKYHAARLARDDDEWMCWGRMYVQMCAVLLSIHDFDVPRRRSEVLSDPVVTLEGEIDRADDSSQTSDRAWSLIRHNDEYLEEVIAYLGYQKNRETVKIVLGLIMSKNFEMGNYDARVRSIMRNIFRVVPLPPKYLFTLESQYSQQTGPFFNQADLCTLGSSVTPFRSLQVCAVALSTGLVMYGVGNAVFDYSCTPWNMYMSDSIAVFRSFYCPSDFNGDSAVD